MTNFSRRTRFFLFFTAGLLWTSATFARPNFNIDSLFFKQIGNTRGCWGFVDSTNNKEYALICATNHLEIWDVTDLDSVKPVKFVAAEPNAVDLKQVRQYKNYAVAVNQFGGTRHAGLQIIEMPDTIQNAATVGVWPGTAPPGDTVPANGAHTVHIDGNYAYVGMNGAAADWYIVDLTNPLNPTEVPGGTYLTPNGGQSHDSYVKGDTGYIAFLQGGFSIVDITNRSAPAVISDVVYPEAFAHNCWPTEDHKYLFTTDELPGGHLRVWDIRNPANPLQVAEWSPPGTSSIIHNVQVKGNFLYAAYYTEGVEILDIEDPTQPVEVGHFDTAPFIEGASFNGCWDFFPYFPSGTLLASNLSNPPGMWLLRFNETKAGQLSGTVVNWETGDPLADVTVRYVGLPRQTKTDSAGNYLFRTEGGALRLEFSLPNFRPETLTVNAFYDSTVAVDTVPLVPTSFLPSTPQGLTARPIDGGNIELSWQKPPDADLDSLHLYRTLLGDTIAYQLLAALAPDKTSYTDVGTVAGERFYYRITSFNSLFESFVSPPVVGMRFAFGPRLLLVNRTGPTSISSLSYYRDTIQNFYFRALRRYDFETLSMKDDSFPLPNGIPANFVTRNRAIFVHSAELYTYTNDNPTFLSYFNDFLEAGGKLVMDGHWAKGAVSNASYLKCLSAEAPFAVGADVWDTLRSAFGFDCIFFPRIFPIDTSLVNRSFLFAEPKESGYPLLVADSGRAAAGEKAFVSPGISYAYPTVPNIGYFSNRNAAEDLYSFGSLSPGVDPKQGQTVAKKHLEPASGGGFVWFNFPLFYMQEDSAKKAIRKSLADLGVPEDFPKGDLDRDGLRQIDDVMPLLNWVFLGQPFEVFDPSEADMNCDGRPTPVDVILLLLNVFPGEPLPCD